MHSILLYALQYFYLFYVIIGASCISTHDMNPIIIKNERKEKSRNPVFGGQNWKNYPSCLFCWQHRNDLLSVSSNYFSNVDCFTGGAFM